MYFLLLAFVLLAMLPIVTAMLYRGLVIDLKKQELEEELQRTQAAEETDWKEKVGLAKIHKSVDTYYSWTRLGVPAFLLTVLYLICFQILWAQLGFSFAGNRHNPFPPSLIIRSFAVGMAFVGVFTFNTGALVRRLYLADLTEHVYWAALNRLVLSLSIAFLLTQLSSRQSVESNKLVAGVADCIVFFSIGFITPAFLEYLLNGVLKGLNQVLNRERVPDKPIQMVEGIDIWRQFRLEEEGIENVQNLATADVIALAVKTHYSLRTLIDWIDQAILIARLGNKVIPLWEAGVATSAIELGWQSPQCTNNTAMAEKIASTLKMDPLLVGSMMNALYQDQYVQTLWTLWQTNEDGQRPRSPVSLRQVAA